MTAPNAGNTFCGSLMAQAWNDLALWEEFLNRNEVRSIIELGTFRGGMSIFLALQAAARGARFVTMDSNLGQVENLLFLEALGSEVIGLDLIGDGSVEKVTDILEELPGPRLLFCDNGNKREEVRRFAPLLAEGDFVAVHDWGSEFFDSDVPPFLRMVWPEPPDESDLTRWFCVGGGAGPHILLKTLQLVKKPPDLETNSLGSSCLLDNVRSSRSRALRACNQPGRAMGCRVATETTPTGAPVISGGVTKPNVELRGYPPPKESGL